MTRTLLFFICLLCHLSPTLAQQDELPGFGDGNVTSLSQEYYLGRAWLLSFRRQTPIISDPLIEGYIETLVYKLAETSQLKDRRLDIVVVNNKSINAFAVPGGVVGVHNGLIMKAETEAQLASVLAHELAHLSQRHFSRGVASQQATSKVGMAGLLAGLVMVAAGSGEAGMATIMGTQAASMQNQLRYSRLHEQEADRLGIQNLAAAGLDPSGAAGMFKVMQQDGRRYGSRPPEFLLTHPVTESRIADGRNRARTYPSKMYEDNPEFQLMRQRVELSFIEDSAAAVARFRRKRAAGGKHAEAAQYGLVLALTSNGEYDEARILLKPLREFSPTNMTYALAEVDIDIEEGELDAAIERLQRGLKLVPNNHPITMALAKAYYELKRFHDADVLLTKHSRNKPKDPNLWYVLAEVQGLAGNTLGLHRSRAEYFAYTGSLQQAMQQLNYALPLATDEITKERINNRSNFFRQVAAALGQL
ncbi:MAG: M48 family metalloprotease [Gammaproteobacteria bacterium]|nr:M48 family metalloprotease [Gammaproteobacteria bacterium]